MPKIKQKLTMAEKKQNNWWWLINDDWWWCHPLMTATKVQPELCIGWPWLIGISHAMVNQCKAASSTPAKRQFPVDTRGNSAILALLWTEANMVCTCTSVRGDQRLDLPCYSSKLNTSLLSRVRWSWILVVEFPAVGACCLRADPWRCRRLSRTTGS